MMGYGDARGTGRTVEVGEACLDGGYDHVLCVLAVEGSTGTKPKPTKRKTAMNITGHSLWMTSARDAYHGIVVPSLSLIGVLAILRAELDVYRRR